MAFSFYPRLLGGRSVSQIEELAMEYLSLGLYLVLWALVFFLGFLLLGALRSLGILKWQLEQLQETAPSRIGRNGLRVGKKAPPFSLPNVLGEDIALADFAGRKVLLVFTQSGCSPCKAIVPELNRLERRGTHQVLVVNNADAEKTRAWGREVDAHFPVLAQENYALSKRFQVLATPFAFVIDEKGNITSKGLAGSRQHLSFVLSNAGKAAESDHAEAPPESADGEASATFVSPMKEVEHV
jgi:methylamine dehydrogenase accessory protein MauD